jgi:REP element-mobilizing transposase RayT
MGLDRRKSRGRECEPPMPDALAYFLTWPTYGTWLPGDERGWVRYRRGMQLPDPILQQEAAARMTEYACRLDHEQRQVVETTIADHCRIRGWTLHAVNCRSNHLHVIVAANRHPDEVREQLKAWCTRRLKDLEHTRRGSSSAPAAAPDEKIRENWWAERGSGLYVNDEDGLETLIQYVCDAQDSRREKHQSELSMNCDQGAGDVD